MKIINKNEPPFSGELPNFTFPKFDVEYANNGVKVIFCKQLSQPLLTIKILIKDYGSYDEPIPGLTKFVSGLLTQGTKKRSSEQIAEEIDYIGANLGANSGWDDSVFEFTCLSEFAEIGFEILSDCLFNSIFSDTEIDRLKRKTIANLEQQKSSPGYLANYTFQKTYFGKHPYSKPLNGTTKSIASINRADCLNLHHSLIDKTELIFIIAGAFKEANILSLINKYFNNITNIREQNNNQLYKPKRQNIISLINKDSSVQSSIRIGKPAIDKTNKDFPAFQLANTIFGGFFGSKLNQVLREELGYTYGIYSNIIDRKRASNMVIGTEVNTDITKDAISKIIELMYDFNNNLIEETKFQAAKQYLLGSFFRSIESPRQLSLLVSGLESSSLPYNYYDNFYKTIVETDSEKLFEIQMKHFKPNNIVITVCGSRDKILKDLSSFGIVQEYELP